MKAMIFAAGLGTRLKPITDTLPKALVPIDGKPLLFRVVSKLKAAGISEFVINVHHFPDSIIGYTHEQNDFGVDVRFSDERDFLRETGGGIKFARPLLEGGQFLVHNVDILSDLDVNWFISQARPEYAAFAEAEAYLIENALVIPLSLPVPPYIATRLNLWEGQYAPTGFSSNRLKGIHILDHYVSMDEYNHNRDAR